MVTASRKKVVIQGPKEEEEVVVTTTPHRLLVMGAVTGDSDDPSDNWHSLEPSER